MASSLHEVLHQMVEVGIELTPRDLPLRDDGLWHNAGKRGKVGYRIERIYTAAGPVYTGVFGFHGKQWFGIRKDDDRVSAEREEWLRQQQANREAADRAKAAEVAKAAMSARERWTGASKTGRSPYLERKGISRCETARFDGNALLIPMVRYDMPEGDRLQGLQIIKADGSKLFSKGMAKAGSSCKLGCVVAGEPMMLAEGFATASTIREAVGYQVPVFVAFDAGNLLPAAQAIRTVWPNPMLICADDDWMTEGNPGRDKARDTAWQVRADFVWPVWPIKAKRDRKHTDFNDLAHSAGINAVRRQLAEPLAALGVEIPND